MPRFIADRSFWRDSVRPIRTDNERAAVERLRYRVSVNEMGKPYPNADHRRQRLSDPLDEVSLILGAFDGDTLIGTVRSTSATERLLHATCGTPLQLNAWQDIDASSLLGLLQTRCRTADATHPTGQPRPHEWHVLLRP